MSEVKLVHNGCFNIFLCECYGWTRFEEASLQSQTIDGFLQSLNVSGMPTDQPKQLH